MIDTKRMSKPSLSRHGAATLATFTLLLCAAPAGAGWLDRGVGVAGAGHSLKETLQETTDLFSEMVGAVIDGDNETAAELMGDVAKTPGKLIKRAFPVLDAPQAIADKLGAATRKIKRFAGAIKDGIADARTALATDKDSRTSAWSDAALLDGAPLPAPPAMAFTAPKQAPTANPADAWDFEQWVMAKQQANPHCYGVVDLETLPPECFGDTGAGTPAADKAQDAPRPDTTDWASGDWVVEDDGWSGWDTSDTRYTEADRDAARVGAFAVRCWGMYEVSRHHGLYDLMRARMQRNECPNEETNQASSDNAGSDYAAALADVLEDNAATPADGDYLSALSDLEAKEAERLRLEEAERQRQARLEAEERERQAQLEAERERNRQAQLAQQQEFNRQAAQQLGQALGGLIRAYSGDVTTGVGGTSGGGTGGCRSRYGEPPSGYMYDYYENNCTLRRSDQGPAP